MNSEYLIFNIIVISGPLIFGAMRPFYFLHRYKHTIIPILIVAVPFLIWDSLVTGRHWFFNPEYILGITLFKLPIEEILFFITVPFACLFTWEMITRRTGDKQLNWLVHLRYLLYLFIPASILFFSLGKEYTGLAFLFFGFSAILDQILKTNLLIQKRFILYFGLIILFTLVFNGFLTWRPVVLYGVEYQLDFRIFTIPIEDFFYGSSMLIMNTIIYQKLIATKYLEVKSENKTSVNTFL